VGVDVTCGITGVARPAIDARDGSDWIVGVVIVGAAGVAMLGIVLASSLLRDRLPVGLDPDGRA